MQELKFEEIKVGMLVQTIDKEIGEVTEIKDSCTIYVRFNGGWIGVFCLDIDDRPHLKLYTCT